MTIYVVGEIMTDIVALTDTQDFAFASDTLAKITFHGGGAGANVASWLGALGMSPVFIGACGNDEQGKVLTEELESFGVITHIRKSSKSTGTLISIVNASGERTMFPDKGANSDLLASWLPQVKKDDLVYVSGYSLLSTETGDEALKILQVSHSQGARVAIDLASHALIQQSGSSKVLSWLNYCDLLFLNVDEGQALFGTREINQILLRLPCLTILKAGGAGSFATGGVHQPAVAAHVVDTTGAGDAYAAGFLSRWAVDQGLQSAMEKGSQCAAEVISISGARPHHP
jgi:sugar/nucleoside kinase (ribokinase family)